MEIRKADSKGRISIGVPNQHFYVHWDAGRITLAPVAGTTSVTIPDREPQPEDGPEYHENHAAWTRRQEQA